ncbi:MAG: single-stranded DNA-binding protein [Candidatus Marinimicrobia bacterium]|jgi:single-strand DNA-binding protein|nr:single-stranded DNA-binding protein [Candidatus Neomarinimicrobiota bacterium]|tara:strand:+ start:3714 stop:4112 length:399 start_codon:yes stop_codon:yes gene_type:complete
MQKGSVNKVVIVGHIGADPETRFTPSGTAVANFNVATNESRKNSDGEYQDHTEWHSCVLFGKRAEFAGEYLKKGQLVYLEGKLQTRSWEDDSGTKKYKTEVLGNEVTMLGKKTGTGGSSKDGDNASDDDLPF